MWEVVRMTRRRVGREREAQRSPGEGNAPEGGGMPMPAEFAGVREGSDYPLTRSRPGPAIRRTKALFAAMVA